ncbi:MAG TPA: dienelactone hydrolase family protein [Candidatus Acidoferrales bacterium]|nr:dienelactone hydrolase family protein [Candidatus Acidoferrales bacterium]
MVFKKDRQWEGIEREVAINAGEVTLNGTLALPKNAVGIVLFAHGSGSSRFSPRNRYVAEVLQSQGTATLLFDLLTLQEESVDEFSARFRFDISLLAKRLVGATRWVMGNPDTLGLHVGYFGASTGAAAALVAASELPDDIAAVVSRGGRPDLANDALESVHAPTLLIVGGDDDVVINLNREALARLSAVEKELVIIPGATHLFEEPGKLEEVAQAAAKWFTRHLAQSRKPQVQTAAQR